MQRTFALIAGAALFVSAAVHAQDRTIAADADFLTAVLVAYQANKAANHLPETYNVDKGGARIALWQLMESPHFVKNDATGSVRAVDVEGAVTAYEQPAAPGGAAATSLGKTNKEKWKTLKTTAKTILKNLNAFRGASDAYDADTSPVTISQDLKTLAETMMRNDGLASGTPPDPARYTWSHLANAIDTFVNDYEDNRAAAVVDNKSFRVIKPEKRLEFFQSAVNDASIWLERYADLNGRARQLGPSELNELNNLEIQHGTVAGSDGKGGVKIAYHRSEAWNKLGPFLRAEKSATEIVQHDDLDSLTEEEWDELIEAALAEMPELEEDEASGDAEEGRNGQEAQNGEK